MRSSTLFLWPAALLFVGACLDIQRTPAADIGGAGGLAGGTGSENVGGAPDFDPTPCVKACVDMTPAGTRNFAFVAACTEDARAGVCAEVCSGAGTGSGPGGATCAVPGDVDTNPDCSQCIKQSCCAELSRCFSDIACITVGICASGCD
jgi:hypothetical protein